MDKIFEQNQSLDVCYKTSDEKYFFTHNDAFNHAKSLKDKKVKKLERPQVPEDLENDKDLEKTNVKPIKRADAVKSYLEQFGEEPSVDFTTVEIVEAMERNVKLETAL
ncbi:MAG: hypothetical protein KBA33_08115 [Cloacibacterium sp.]|nr:hypothetical protein [Cloacibacterium sp.]